MFETFEHTADLGLRAKGDSLEEVFVEAARGLTSMIIEDVDAVSARESVDFQIPGDQADYLLFDWLNELLYCFESQQQLFCDFQVRIDSGGLTAQAKGETIDLDRHRLVHEVKAITYHQLKVEQNEEGWLAELIVDI